MKLILHFKRGKQGGLHPPRFNITTTAAATVTPTHQPMCSSPSHSQQSQISPEIQEPLPQNPHDSPQTLEPINPSSIQPNPDQKSNLDHLNDNDAVDPEEGAEEDREEQENPGAILSAFPPPPSPLDVLLDPHVRMTSSPSSHLSKRPSFNKRKKGKGSVKKQQAIEKKLQTLTEKLNPVPFIPSKVLDFAKHEKLLRRLGLWDFFHIEFDRSIRADLIAQLIANYDPKLRCSYVNDFRIAVNRADLARAFKLPVKKDKVGNIDGVDLDLEALSEESIGFIEGFVSNWVLLHEDTWMMPNEVLNWTKAIKDGHPEKVDWAGLFWFMVEKELLKGEQLVDCYYASHLQYLIKSQREKVMARELETVVLNEEQDRVDLDADEVVLKEEQDRVDLDVAEVVLKEEQDRVDLDVAEVVLKEEQDSVNLDAEEVVLKEEQDRVDLDAEELVLKEEQDRVDLDAAEVVLKQEQDGVDLDAAEVVLKEEQDRVDLDVAEVVLKEEHDRVDLDGEEVVLSEGKEGKVELDEENVVLGEEHDGVELGAEKVVLREEHDGVDLEDAVVKDKDDGGDLKMGGVNEVQEQDIDVSEGPNVELTLGQDVGEEEEVKEAEMMDVEEDEEQEQEQEMEMEQRQWLLDGKNDSGEHFMQRCDVGDAEGFDSIDEGKEEVDELEGDEEDGGEAEDGFDVGPSDDALGDGLTGNFLQALETNQMAFGSQGHLRDDPSINLVGDRNELQHMAAGGPSFYSNNGKREIDHEDDILHHSLNGSNKRLRIDGSWDHKPLDFGTCMEQMQQLMDKARVMYDVKEQAQEQSSMNQQILINELQKRDNMIDHLHKIKCEEIQKRDAEMYRLQRELYLMGNLLDDYRKALKQTNKSFTEYRQKCQLPEEPIYEDAGPGGVVLSSSEIEKQRLKEEEEYKLTCVILEQKSKEAEEEYALQFGEFLDRVHLLEQRLTDVESTFSELRDSYGKPKVSEAEQNIVDTSECPPIE